MEKTSWVIEFVYTGFLTKTLKLDTKDTQLHILLTGGWVKVPITSAFGKLFDKMVIL